MQWNLIRARKENGETQKDMADVLDISEESYRNKELGKTQFKMNEMFILADHYNTKVDDIFLATNFTVRKGKS